MKVFRRKSEKDRKSGLRDGLQTSLPDPETRSKVWSASQCRESIEGRPVTRWRGSQGLLFRVVGSLSSWSFGFTYYLKK